jgi:hypothetical protein
MIDTLDIYKKLKATGLTARQSEAIAKTIGLSVADRTTDLLTTKDLAVWTSFGRNELETASEESTGPMTQSIRKIEYAIQNSIENSAQTVIQWIVGSHIATLIGLVALAKAGAVF